MSSTEGTSSPPPSQPPSSSSEAVTKKKEKARVSRTSLILWHAHQNDVAGVRKLLEEDRELGQNGSHFEPRPVPPPLSNKCDWEIDPAELDFSNSIYLRNQDFKHDIACEAVTYVVGLLLKRSP
ncbi:hypothetical protein Leryth_002221 [Lithospermum erythrorhizon]|nr:hypothetical protein Leryth_002221 [Lithospermum erythrorhizon]